MSGRMFVCSTGIKVNLRVVTDAVLDFAIMEVISSMISTGVFSMAMMMSCRRVERQRGIRAAGVEGTQNFRVICALSVWCRRSRPKVG